MTHYVHELTDVERTFGVTLAQVQHLLPKGLFIDFGEAFVLPQDTEPALATSTARAAFGGDNAEYADRTYLDRPVY